MLKRDSLYFTFSFIFFLLSCNTPKVRETINVASNQLQDTVNLCIGDYQTPEQAKQSIS